MATIAKTKNQRTELIEAKLKPMFPSAEAYQYNSVSIRVRIIDEVFSGKSKVARTQMVAPYLSELPEDLEADVTLLLLLTSEETRFSMMNTEFDYPTPSML